MSQQVNRNACPYPQSGQCSRGDDIDPPTRLRGGVDWRASLRCAPVRDACNRYTSVRKKVVMLMTQMAMMDPGPAGDSILSRCCRAIGQFFGFGVEPERMGTQDADTAPLQTAWIESDSPAPLRIVSSSQTHSSPTLSHKWQRHQQLRDRPTSALPVEERHARQEAVRGLYAAQAGAYEAAVNHFAQAAACSDVDLSAVPGFWNLNRTAMITAVRAYEATDRLRDASALEAMIRSRFRPRVLSPIPDNVTELPTRRSQPLTSNT